MSLNRAERQLVRWTFNRNMLLRLFFVIITLFGLPQVAGAHAFGQSYTLPVPAWLFIYGGAAAVVVSFLLIASFVGSRRDASPYRMIDITNNPLIRFLHRPVWQYSVRSISMALFALMLVTGFGGIPDPTLNFAPTFFWVIFLLGVTYLSAIAGNVWQLLSPFKTITQVYEAITRRPIKGRYVYPEKLGYYPALLAYIFLICHELFLGPNPFLLASLSVAYVALTLWGVYLYGPKSWLAHAEFLTVFFGLISRLAPIEKRGNKLYLRPPLVGLLDAPPSQLSLLLFIVFMLASTAFDGIRETTNWTNLLVSTFTIYDYHGHDFFLLFEVFLLLTTLGLFCALYLLAVAVMKIITHSTQSIVTLGLAFAYSLIPIALVYNLAHYGMLLFVQGQAIIPLLSDPLGRGWNLFHTAFYTINPSPLNAAHVWYVQVFLIVSGHIASVYLAHRVALRFFPSARKAMLSQYPMLVLMVVYTMAGLWILSQPLTVGR